MFLLRIDSDWEPHQLSTAEKTRGVAKAIAPQVFREASTYACFAFRQSIAAEINARTNRIPPTTVQTFL